MSPTIRPATHDDYALYLKLLPELGVDDPPPSPERWRDEFVPNAHIAELNGTPAGLLYAVTLAETGYVRNLIVDPAARRHGVGRALLEFYAQQLRAKGRTGWALNVKPDNVAAIRLYEAMGFRRRYASVALRLDWVRVSELPESPPLHARPVAPADDAVVERLFALAPGQLQGLRESKRVLLTLVDATDRLHAIAAFNPSFPGSFPFRTTDPRMARALLEAMRPHALANATYVNLVVEDDEALAALLRSHGAQVRMNVDHYAGPLD